MLEFSKSEKYRRLNGRFLYASAVRSVLQGTPIGSDDLMHTHISLSHKFGYANYFYPTCKEYDEEKATLFAAAALLSYIPYGRAGYEYVAGILGNKPVWEYQYENALNTLTLDDAFFDTEEKAELREMFRQYGSDTVKADFCGFVLVILRTYIACFLASPRIRDWGNIAAKIYQDVEEQGLTEINLSEYLPKNPDDKELTEKEITFINDLLKYQRRNKAFEVQVCREDFASATHGFSKTLLGGSALADGKVGDILKFTWDSLVLEAKVTGVSSFAETQIPTEAYAAAIKPLQNGDKTVNEKAIAPEVSVNCENGYESSEVLLSFEAAERSRQNYGYYTVEYNKSVLGDLKARDNFTLLLVDKKLYESIYMYPQFLLYDTESNTRMIAGGKGYNVAYSKEELLEKIDKTLPLTVPISAIEEGAAFTDEDYALGIMVLPLHVDKME